MTLTATSFFPLSFPSSTCEYGRLWHWHICVWSFCLQLSNFTCRISGSHHCLSPYSPLCSISCPILSFQKISLDFRCDPATNPRTDGILALSLSDNSFACWASSPKATKSGVERNAEMYFVFLIMTCTSVWKIQYWSRIREWYSMQNV
jgi:hypothetical protein